jgi:hypothetical protein
VQLRRRRSAVVVCSRFCFDSADEATNRIHQRIASSTLQSKQTTTTKGSTITPHVDTYETRYQLSPDTTIHSTSPHAAARPSLVMTSRRLAHTSNSIHPPAGASSSVSSQSIHHTSRVLESSDLSAVIAVDRI